MIDLAILFGTFEGFNPDYEGEYTHKFIKETFPDQYKRMMLYGRRNVSFSTAAPTGSQAILTQTTSGIEPLFLPFYLRRKKLVWNFSINRQAKTILWNFRLKL